MEEIEQYDVTVIGGGVVGCAILRELSRYRLKSILIEAHADVAEETSKANSGVIHAGFNVPTETLKARLNVRGLELIYPLARELAVPHRKTGKLVVSPDDEGKGYLLSLKKQGDANGSLGLEIIGSDQIEELEPLARGKWALYSPHTGIISPYLFTIALAEHAQLNGAEILLESPVTKICKMNDSYLINSDRKRVNTRWVINAAGLNSDKIAQMAGMGQHRIYPYRGQYLLTDKAKTLGLKLPVYPVPPKDGPGLGVHVTPTIDGNVLLGPSAAFINDRQDFGTTRNIMNQLREEAYELIPKLKEFSFIRSFSGIRPKRVDPYSDVKFQDFIIEEDKDNRGFINLIGIESPGLTSSPAIAEYVLSIMAEMEKLEKKNRFFPPFGPKRRFSEMDDKERREAVEEDPAWGEMICRCETVTRKEVETALENPLGVKTLDGIKRRTRCGMGRCQGGFCSLRIIELMNQHDHKAFPITKKGKNSPIVYGDIK